MASLVNNAVFLASSSGTGSFAVSSAVQGYQTPAAAGAVDGKKYRYRAQSADLSQWEEGDTTSASTATSFARTVTASSAGGTTTVSFTAAPTVALTMMAADVLQFDDAMSLTALQQGQAQRNIGVPAVMRGYLSGLTLSTAGGSTSFGISAGVGVDSTNAYAMTLASAITKTMSSWAVGSTNGSLDTGTIAASTMYHIYLIQRPDTGVVDVLSSLSASSPTMPTNYTLARRIGSIRTDASTKWLAFTQIGDEFILALPIGDLNISNLGAATLYTLSVPPSTKAHIRMLGTHASAVSGVLITAPQESSPTWNVPPGNVTATMPSTTTNFNMCLDVQTDSSSRISALAPSTNTVLQIATWGWADRRGRDA